MRLFITGNLPAQDEAHSTDIHTSAHFTADERLPEMAVIVEVLGAERDGSAAIQIDDLHRGRGRVACRRPLSKAWQRLTQQGQLRCCYPEGMLWHFLGKKTHSF